MSMGGGQALKKQESFEFGMEANKLN